MASSKYGFVLVEVVDVFGVFAVGFNEFVMGAIELMIGCIGFMLVAGVLIDWNLVFMGTVEDP